MWRQERLTEWDKSYLLVLMRHSFQVAGRDGHWQSRGGVAPSGGFSLFVRMPVTVVVVVVVTGMLVLILGLW